MARKVCENLNYCTKLALTEMLFSSTAAQAEHRAAIAAKSQQSPNSPCTILSAWQATAKSLLMHAALGMKAACTACLNDGEKLGIP